MFSNADSRVLFLLLSLMVLFGSLLPSVSGHADGAGACFGTNYNNDLSAFIASHGGKESTATGNYKIVYHTNNAHPANQFIPGCSYTVTICRPAYTATVADTTPFKEQIANAASKGTTKGLLLLSKGAADTSGYSSSFSIPKMSSSLLKPMSCSGDVQYPATNGAKSAVITHSDNTPKLTPINVVWNAADDAESITLHLFAIGAVQSDWYHLRYKMSANHALHGGACPALVNPPADVCGPVSGNNTNNNNNGNINDGLDININSGAGGHGGHGGGHEGGAMFGYFNNNLWQGQKIIFPSWNLNTRQQYSASVLCLLLLSFFAEFLSFCQSRLERYWNRLAIRNQVSVIRKGFNNNNNVTTINNNNPTTNNDSDEDEYPLHQQSIRTVFYLFRTFLSMILMIAFMSMDVGFFLAVLFGYTAGFFFFGKFKGKTKINPNNNNNYNISTDIEQGGKTAACH